MKKILFTIGIFTLFMQESCTSTKTAAYQNYPTVCLGKSMDGTQRLQVWASGKNSKDAILQAKKKAVYEMVFQGIQAGGTDCDTRPIVIEANARHKYEEYFDKFFSDGGAYKEFVERIKPNAMTKAVNKQKGQFFKTDGIVVSVNTSAIKRKLVADGIIKQ